MRLALIAGLPQARKGTFPTLPGGRAEGDGADGGAPATFGNQALKSGSNLNYPATVPFGSSNDLK